MENKQEVTAQEALFLYQQNALTIEECQYYMALRADMVRKAISDDKNKSSAASQAGLEADIKLL